MHGNRVPRRRRFLPASVLPWLRVIGFRYDYTLDAYVLIGIGKRWGPVVRDEARRSID